MAYPNPVHDELNITFRTAQPVTATLTNMLGQVVATQRVAGERVVFKTATFPAGLYVYSLQAGGERYTGRVVIVH